MSPNVKANALLTLVFMIIFVVYMTREEINKRLDELAREYVATHNHEIVEELYRLARELEKMDKEVET